MSPPEPWQTEEFLAHVDRARAAVDPWIPWASRSTDLDSARAMLQRYADLAARDAGRLYGIWLDGTLVGLTMFVAFDATVGTCEIGCWLEPAAQGWGLITRAAGHFGEWAVFVRGVHRVEWHTRPDNTASRNVARRLGMRLDGVLREEFPYRGSCTTPRSGRCWHRSGSAAHSPIVDPGRDQGSHEHVRENRRPS